MQKKLSKEIFVISQIFILVFGLVFVSALYYLVNVQYQAPTAYSKLQGPVTTAPKSLRVELERPDNDMLSFDQSIIVSGKTGPNLEILIITNNQDLIVKSDKAGNFSTFVKLNEGVNKITAAVFDATGDNRSAERTVYYSKEKI